MKIDKESDANVIVGIANSIYNHTKNKLCLMGMITYDERFRWKMGAGIKNAIVSSVMMIQPETDDEFCLFGCKVEFDTDDPWELSLWYDMTEI